MKIEHGFRDWKHHLRLKIPSSRLVRSSRRAAVLVNAIVSAYWLLCLVGLKALPKGFQRQVTSWGKARFFRLALELVTSGPSPGAIPKMLGGGQTGLPPSTPDFLAIPIPTPPSEKWVIASVATDCKRMLNLVYCHQIRPVGLEAVERS